MDEKEHRSNNLFVNSQGDIFLNENKTNKYFPQEISEYWKSYVFTLDRDVYLYFDDINLLKKTHFLKIGFLHK